MKTKMKRWMLATVLVATGGAAAQAQESNALSQGAIGDLPGYGEDTYFAEEAAYSQPAPAPPAASANNDYAETQQVAHQDVAYASPSLPQSYRPVSASQLQQTSFLGGGCSAASGSCDGGSCDGGCSGGCSVMSGSCDGGCGSSGGCGCGGSMVGRMCNPAAGRTWANFEALLWFVEGRDTVPLLTTNTLDAVPTITGGSDVAFGSPIDSGLNAGFRADAGVYLGDNIGVGGRYWQLYGGEESATVDDPTRAIGRPFFNIDPSVGGDDAFLVQFGDGPGGLINDRVGSATATSDVDLWAAEAYARVRFSGAKNHSLDFIGGYTHLELDESLSIFSTTTFIDGSVANPAGTIVNVTDQFDIDNNFDGGQLGFEAVLTRGKWMARSLTKVHIGNMQQTFSGSGSTTRDTVLSGATTTNVGVLNRFNNGAFEIEQDQFAFIPEANFKLAYQVRPNMLFSVGYSFLYLDNVATSASAISGLSQFDSLNPNGPFDLNAPPGFRTDSLFVHGVDLGVVLDF